MMMELFELPGSIVSVDIIGLNDVTQVKSWKFPAGTSESRPARLGIIQGETQQPQTFLCLVSFHIQHLNDI